MQSMIGKTFSQLLLSGPRYYYSVRLFHPSPVIRSMELKQVVSKLEEFASSKLAESWDNVGLLIEPSSEKQVKVAFLTNDLTEPVLEEALNSSADLIISYHPPLFRPIKRLDSRSWKTRIAVKCIENRVALYSPHTSWDVIPGGINTWLLTPYGPGEMSLVNETLGKAPVSHTVSVSGVPLSTDQLTQLLSMSNINVNLDQTSLSVGCNKGQLSSVICSLPESLQENMTITEHSKPPIPDTGAGRKLSLETSLTVQEVVDRTKAHLGMSHLRLALANSHSMDSKVTNIAVCAGSGGSVLSGVFADLIVTGEMSHHEVLDFVSAGVSVILADHSNTERGFLTHIKENLSSMLDGVNVIVSRVDKDPLQIV